MEDSEAEDLRAFERRLTEVVGGTAEKPSPFRWRLVLGATFACTAISACHWLRDAQGGGSLLFRMLSSHSAFACSLATFCLLLVYGLNHAAKQDPPILRDTRETLSTFWLNCDNQGRLIRVQPSNNLGGLARSRTTSTNWQNK
ncbi:nuclear envelope phosphatase-regulatory subunit 1 homolog [Drosophila elegans]|uniref:nuclear envelope phosphatase-regulatory subunit 1 homolog n=1 Tax=Drosophila elegans TaxID=30023 RepID=UPI0007E5F58D|nr:nuclear envelope phosphatase-regulatory subunit 1 homolog [Drosophila elegans]XP_017119332.1 nuclear envelope phosphatase-regulatory subunit 1 homolog [Drosophila elegans]